MNSVMKMAKGQYIDVIYNSYTEMWKNMVMQHYDIPIYENTMIFSFPLNSFVPKLDEMHTTSVPMEIKEGQRLQYLKNSKSLVMIDLDKYLETYSKIIWYDLERPYPVPYPYHQNPYIFERVYEVWTPWIESLPYYPDEYRDKYVFKPFRYTDRVPDLKSNSENIEWDFGFIGAPAPWESPYRSKFMQMIFDSFVIWHNNGEPYGANRYRYWNAGGKLPVEVADLIRKTHIILDLPADEFPFYSQNVLRLNELVSAGCVCASNSGNFNYFPDIVYFSEGADLGNMINLIHSIVFENSQKDIANTWKRMTFKDIDYESYINHMITLYKEKNGSIWTKLII